jgi:hypothetical protein
VFAYHDCTASWLSELLPSELTVRICQGRAERLRVTRELCEDIHAWKPDFLYLRQETYYPALGRAMGTVPSVIELNGDDVEEARSGPLYYFLYRIVSRRLLMRRARGFVSVSRHLALLPAFRRFQLPTTVIANGIDLSTVPELPPPDSAGLRFGFLGSPFGRLGHGVEKIVDLARRRPDWSFELIGPNPTGFGDLPRNVRAHGMLDQARYEPIMATCDVAIGPLSGYEKQTVESSALKVRQYFGYGIPTLSGVADTDFPDGAPFLLVLPNTPNNVASSIGRIEEFARKWKGKRIARSAVQHLDAAHKERLRLEFVEGVISGRLPPRGTIASDQQAINAPCSSQVGM